MRGTALLVCLVSSTAGAQQPPTPTLPTPPPAAARAESVAPPPPPPPTLAQERFTRGLSTAGRGIAQLKIGIYSVVNAGRDAPRLRQAGRRLAGFCGTARQFMTSGRARMAATAYEDSTALKARRLSAQIDTLIRFAPTCEAKAATQPDSTTTRLLDEIRAYEAALKDFRAAIGLPNK